ncbi:alpha/beta hydrolase [Asanoa sp. NPDC049573]|uniref:alpha/beta hydrolase family protein n=1 Tax=Asanoa sp. NPDC049573 TaxID=3155396 RepID=UPI00342B6F60
MRTDKPVVGSAAGVPFLAVPPASGRATALVVVGWHLLDPPRTEAAFAAALPLTDLDAWRIYLGLPMCGARLPSGGFDELMRRGYEDAVLNLQGPIATQGAEEFPAALAALRDRLGFDGGPLALVGGSMGSAVALLALAESAPAAGLAISAAVLISPISQLRAAVEATGRRYGISYGWGPASTAVAQRLDFVARAADVAAGQPAIRFVVGAADDEAGFRAPARRLADALAATYADPTRVDVVTIAGMGHALADEPGIAPAPQTAAAADVERRTVGWLAAHLPADDLEETAR